MTAIAHAIILAQGWRRRGIAFVAGAIGAAAMAPVDFMPAMLVMLCAAVWLIDGAAGGGTIGAGALRSRLSVAFDAARAGWWLGFGYFVAGLWWLGAAFLVEPDKFLWALPFATLGLPAVLAFFTAAGFFTSALVWSSGAGRLFALAAGLGAAEWLRGVILTGFPWNTIGMTLGGTLPFAQTASFVGLHGLTFLTIAIFAAPATLVDKADMSAHRGFMRRIGAAPIGVAVAAFVTMGVFGALRLSMATTDFDRGVKLRIMQPNLPQDEKFRSENKDRILRHYLSVSDRATSPASSGVSEVTHLVWPESVFPYVVSRDAESLSRIAAMLGDNVILITGAARSTTPARRLPGESNVVYFNSIHVIGKGGAILDTYDKSHLVPFGEYLPFSGLLERFGVRHLVHIPGGFEPAGRRKALAVPMMPLVAPLICYEAVFPGEATPNDGKAQRPGLLLNVTNDAWFGTTSGPYQHFAQARLRAVEEGLPLVRAANTGISAVIDPVGRVIRALPLGVEGVIDSALPKPLPATLFALYPLAGPFALLAMMLGVAFFGRIREG